ncbi:hypothetical protein RclHR1_00080049 [Rhizophagus clarus]|uniref:Kinase-like domain-containing protein n=1 Tax=Rhizophagus clarus TaxID=94130 RepID=A0A2Z6SEQ6_9GLOM|nr:hypothetical protein RclHR1_00080049 [Rhizophagus clarus]GES89952.1 kinase-like domain-containing protein [Rhizophagus clarus]
MDNKIPLINVPYPPELTVEEILSRRSDVKLGSRAPNRFFIYRLTYIKELRRRTCKNISMTKISPYISTSWSKEPSEVKDAYKELSELVESQLVKIRQNFPVIIHESFLPPPPTDNILEDERLESQIRQTDTLATIHENFPSPSPPPPISTDIVDGSIFFYSYLD